MKRLTSLAILSVLAACQSAPHIPLFGDVFAPKSADEALETYYRTLPDEFYPRAPQGVALPDEGKAMTRIFVASCLDGSARGAVSTVEGFLAGRGVVVKPRHGF